MINNNDNALIFPTEAISALRNVRESVWEELIDQISNLTPLDEERLAFILMITRITGCATCQADSFKAMRGCTQCALLSIKRYRGSDQELIIRFTEAKDVINRYLHED